MRLTINTSEAQSFEPAEPGLYQMTVHSVSNVRQSESEKKTKGVDIDFEFADPELAKRHGRVRRFYPVEGKGAGFFATLWKNLTDEELPIGSDEGINIDVDTDDIQGLDVIVHVGNQTSQKLGDDRIFNTAEKVLRADRAPANAEIAG